MTIKPRTYADEMAALDAASRDGQPARDAQHFRRIIAARNALASAEAELVAAVGAAREAGDSWTVVGAALGTTRQGAFRKFSGAEAIGGTPVRSITSAKSAATKTASKAAKATKAARAKPAAQATKAAPRASRAKPSAKATYAARSPAAAKSTTTTTTSAPNASSSRAR